MPDWYLNRALTNFRAAVNDAYPRRDKESDGTIGDKAHQSRPSDHNPDRDGSVDAWDMDVEVNGRGKPYAADVEALKRVFESHESSRYWIHDDEICERSNGWRRRPYNPDDPDRNKHIKHVHWNTRESHEDSTAPWNVEDDVTPEQAQQLRDSHFTLAKAINNPAGEGSVPLHVWAEWMTDTVKALAVSQAKSDAELGAKLNEIDGEADARAVAEEQRFAALTALLEQHASGQLSAEEVVQRLAERLAA